MSDSDPEEDDTSDDEGWLARLKEFLGEFFAYIVGGLIVVIVGVSMAIVLRGCR